MSSRVSTILVAAVTGALIIYAVPGRKSESRPPTVTLDMRWVDQIPRILEADDHGAIVSTEGLLRGVTRDGQTRRRTSEWSG